MISVKKNFISQPTGLLTTGCKNQIELTLSQYNSHSFSSYYYRDKTLQTLKTLYHNKCAYCETAIGPSSTLRVDHYRPKDKVIEANKTCKGYYWLGYEWSNLLPACETCNRAKSNHFPLVVEGNRITNPIIAVSGKSPTAEYLRSDLPVLRGEDALLLNPELDKVEEHLIFKPDGTVKHLTKYGEKSIEVYKLNRDDLVLSRKRNIDKIIREVKKLLSDYLVDNIINEKTFNYSLNNLYKKLALRRSPSYEYSRLATLNFVKFDLFVANQLPSKKYQEIISGTFKLFLNGKLYP